MQYVKIDWKVAMRYNNFRKYRFTAHGGTRLNIDKCQ